MFIYHIISATPTCSFGTLQTYTFETFPKWWNPTRSFSLHPLSGNKSIPLCSVEPLSHKLSMRLVSPSNFSAGLLKDANDWRKGTTTTRKSKGHMIYICVPTAAATLKSLAPQNFLLWYTYSLGFFCLKLSNSSRKPIKKFYISKCHTL